MSMGEPTLFLTKRKPKKNSTPSLTLQVIMYNKHIFCPLAKCNFQVSGASSFCLAQKAMSLRDQSLREK